MPISNGPNPGSDRIAASIMAAVKRFIQSLAGDVDALVAAGEPPADEWARMVMSDIAPHLGAEFIATAAASLPPVGKRPSSMSRRMAQTDGLIAWPQGVEGPPTVAALLAEYPQTFSGVDPADVRVIIASPRWTQKFSTYMRETTNLVVGMSDTVFSDMQAAIGKVGPGAGVFDRQKAARAFLSWEGEGGYVGWMRRAETIARTETATARNMAAQAAAEELADSGVPTMKRWVAARDERTRESHRAVHGTVVEAHEFFTVGNDRMLGPGDREHGSAKETINCRCKCTYLEDYTLAEAESLAEDLESWEDTPLEELERMMNEKLGITASANGVDAKMWKGKLAPLGEPTGDGRVFTTDGEFRFRSLPLPLLWQESTGDGHDASRVVGTIDYGEVTADGFIAEGTIFADEEKVLALLDKGVVRPSVDLCDMVAEEFASEDDPDGYPMLHVTSATVMAATLVAKPAFENVNVTLTGEDATVEPDSLAASAGAVTLAEYQSEAFADPGLTGPTPLTVTDDGRVFGHLALWDSCHVGMPGRCVKPPRSSSGYASFHQSTVRTEDGPVAVGRLTVGGGHADARGDFRAAAEHYDQTGAAWAMVRAGEDKYGIWVAGQVHPDATEAQVNAGASAPLSGDWRRIGGGMELVAALSVSTPGFPVRREYTAVSGEAMSLVAAAQVSADAPESPGESPAPLTEDDVVRIVRENVRSMMDHPAGKGERTVTASADTLRRERAERRAAKARSVFAAHKGGK